MMKFIHFLYINLLSKEKINIVLCFANVCGAGGGGFSENFAENFVGVKGTRNSENLEAYFNSFKECRARGYFDPC